jgi:putative flippase GtrA
VQLNASLRTPERFSVTSLSLLRRPVPRAGVPERTTSGAEGTTTVRGTSSKVLDRLRGDDATAQFGRFVFVGGVSSLLYAVAFLVFRGLGDQLANVIGAVLSSMLANEMHRRLTFHADGRISWFTAQWEGGGLALVGILATGLALDWLDDTTGVTGSAARLVLVGVVTGAIGLVRFVALRWFFAARPSTSA